MTSNSFDHTYAFEIFENRALIMMRLTLNSRLPLRCVSNLIHQIYYGHDMIKYAMIKSDIFSVVIITINVLEASPVRFVSAIQHD